MKSTSKSIFFKLEYNFKLAGNSLKSVLSQLPSSSEFLQNFECKLSPNNIYTNICLISNKYKKHTIILYLFIQMAYKKNNHLTVNILYTLVVLYYLFFFFCNNTYIQHIFKCFNSEEWQNLEVVFFSFTVSNLSIDKNKIRELLRFILFYNLRELLRSKCSRYAVGT